jgi:hypothetical protein
MSKELPYFKFHSSEWLLNRISDENYRVKGIFIDLCAYYWHKECTVSYKEVCKKLGKTNVKLMQDLNFLLIKNDEIVIKFLDEQRAELSDLQAKRSKAGKKGRQAQLEQTPSKSQAPLGHLDKDKIREDKIREEKKYSIKDIEFFNKVFDENFKMQINSFLAKEFPNWVHDEFRFGQPHIDRFQNKWKNKLPKYWTFYTVSQAREQYLEFIKENFLKPEVAL